MINQNGRPRLSWEKTAIKLAFNIAEYRSEDPHLQVGSVIIKNDNSIVLGYNGSVKGQNIDWSNRDERRKRVIHAEENVLMGVLTGETKLLACTDLPCPSCIRLIAQKGIKKVYYTRLTENYNHNDTFLLAKEFGVELIQLDNN